MECWRLVAAVTITIMASVAVLRSERVLERERAIPWHLWAGVLAATCAVAGGQWDISWHRTIGRDTFWTPAHILIYLCGVIGGLSGAWVVLAHTFRGGSVSVRVWGFRGPLGAFMCIWGAVAMLTSAPFDNWWHSAYGLDVKILSPPHVVLLIGLVAIQIGALIQILGEMNRADGKRRAALEWMYLYICGVIFTGIQTTILEYTFRSNMHRAQFYRVAGSISILVLAALARVSSRRWAATTISAIYSLFLISLILVLPLFPGEPKLGPVYQKVTHFIPPEFPLLLIFPAIGLDLLLKRFDRVNKWILAAVCGAAFLAVFLAVQWPFANFLVTPAARNWFFGAHYLAYMVQPTTFYARYMFLPEPLSTFAGGMGFALVATVLAARFGLGWGDWMRTIQR